MGMAGRLTLSAVVGVVVIGVVSANADTGAGGGSSGSGSEGSSASAGHNTTGTNVPGTPQAVTRKKVSLDGDGDFRVGRDIEPGTYRSRGNTDGPCYWERAKDAAGDTNSLLANGRVRGTGYVTVKATDKVFKSSGCKGWEAVDAKAQGSPATRMTGDGGMFRVGVDIAPGTYTSTGNTDDGCYWERARDAEHGPNSILAHDTVTGTAVITISTQDAYFTTSGCKNWTKTA